VKTVTAPPASYMPKLSRISSVAFGGGGRPSSLRIRGRKRWCALTFIDSSPLANPLLTAAISSGGAAAYYGGAIPLVGTGYVIGDPIWTIGRLFNKYRVHRFCVEFTPRVGTITNASFAMAYSPDPNWAQDHDTAVLGVGGIQRYAPTEYAITQLTTAVQLPVWSPAACLDCTSMLPKQDLFVSSEDTFGFQSSEVGIASASLRQNTNFGTLLLSGSENPVGVTEIGTFGDLFIEYDFEYWDMGITQQIGDPFGPHGAVARSTVETPITIDSGGTSKELALEKKRREPSPAPVGPRR